MSDSCPWLIQHVTQDDFFWIKSLDVAPLAIERDSIYLLFCAYFSDCSFVSRSSAGERVGFLLGFVSPHRVAYVHYLFVQAAFRGQGVGRALMNHYLSSVRELGAERCMLFTARAKSFYAGLGFLESECVYSPCVLEYLRETKGVTTRSRELNV